MGQGGSNSVELPKKRFAVKGDGLAVGLGFGCCKTRRTTLQAKRDKHLNDLKSGKVKPNAAELLKSVHVGDLDLDMHSVAQYISFGETVRRGSSARVNKIRESFNQGGIMPNENHITADLEFTEEQAVRRLLSAMWPYFCPFLYIACLLICMLFITLGRNYRQNEGYYANLLCSKIKHPCLRAGPASQWIIPIEVLAQ